MDTLTVALLVAGLAAISFSTRASFILYFARLRLPGGVQRGLRFVPPAVFAALVVPELLYAGGGLRLELGNEKLVAGLVAAFVAWRSHNTLATILVGMVALHLHRHLFGSG
jgi:branched-subunit amino acid transport protein